jgi:hypothetical protein
LKPGKYFYTQSKNYAKNNKYTNLTSLVNDNFHVINGILLHDAVIVKPKHIVSTKKRVLTKNFTVFIKFLWFNAFFDEAFTVTSRSKTIAALRLCVLDANGYDNIYRDWENPAAKPKKN